MMSVRLQRFRIVALAAVAAGFLGGCVLRVAYNQLDWLALWYLQDYVDLDAEQEVQAKALIADTLAWHRRTQLPRYAGLIRNLRDSTSSRVEPAVVAVRYGEIVTLWDELLAHATPGLAGLLKTLSDEQVDELFASLADENRDLEEDFAGIGREARRAKQDKAIIKAFRRFTGRLTPEQEALVKARTARFHDLSADWLQRRGAWQTEFRRILMSRRDDPRFVARCVELFTDPNQFDAPSYRRLVVENQQASFSLVAAVLNSLEPRQTDDLRKRLTTWLDDLALLTRTSEKGTRHAEAT